MRALLMICSFLLCADTALALQVTEVMYNPQGDDDGREFIELFAETLPDLSGFSVADSVSNDSLVLLRNGNAAYAVIVEEGADLTALGIDLDVAVYTIGAAIGNSLGNAQDTVSLFDAQGALLDYLQYNGTLANGNGKSLVLAEGVWQESVEIGGSPGRPNTPVLMTAPPNASVAAVACNGAFNFTTDKLLYNSGEQVRMQFALSDEDSPFLITYWAADLRGTMVRSPRNTTNANAKTFTAHSDGADQVLLLHAQYQPYCNRSRVVEQQVQVVILGEGMPAENSTLAFRDPPTAAVFGDTLTIELEAYRANTRKSAVEVYVADGGGIKVSKTAKFTAAEQFTHAVATVELSLYASCSGKYQPGAHQLIAKGIDALAVQPLMLTAAPCDGAEKAIGDPTAEEVLVNPHAALELSFTDFPATAEAGSVHVAGVAIVNPSPETRTVDIWSYAYRGSVSLSGEREANRQTVEIAPGETQQVLLEIALDDELDAGDAWYKVKALEAGRKTPIEVREQLTIIGHASASLSLRAALPAPEQDYPPALTEITGGAVYRSKQADIKQLTVYFLLMACLVVISLLIWRGK